MNETMAGLIVLCFSVLLVYLLWRVWRLEDKVDRAERNLIDNGKDIRDLATWRWRQIDTSEVVAFARRHTESLARALGYEWKRTEAKEGWEKKPDGFWIGGPTGDPVDRRGTRPDRRREAKKPRRAH